MKHTKEFWDRQPLGQLADYKIAGKVGVAESTVARQRKLRGILAFGRAGNMRIPRPIAITKKDARIINRKYTALQKAINTLENKIIDLRIAFYKDLPSYIGDSDIAEIMGCCEATVRKYRSIIDPNYAKNIIYEEKEII